MGQIGGVMGKIHVEAALTMNISNRVTQYVTPFKMPNLVTISRI